MRAGPDRPSHSVRPLSETVLDTDLGVAPPAQIRRSHPLARFVVRRVLAGLATLLVVSVLVFWGTEVLPGDAASAVLGRTAQPEQLAELQQQMGLDRPAIERYFDWLGGLFTGDLGNSAAGYAQGSETSIWSQISGKLTNSLILAAIVIVLMVPLSLLLGALAARRAARPADHVVSIASLILISLPEFVLGALLILFFFSWLDVLPAGRADPARREPALRARQARPAGADPARRNAGRVDAHGSRRDDRDASRRLRPDGAPQRLP